AFFGGQAPAAFWALPLYLILRLGLVRRWRARRRGAALRSVISPAPGAAAGAGAGAGAGISRNGRGPEPERVAPSSRAEPEGVSHG
ncbi:MAG: hypothetical protein ACE5JJ_11875, partial [Nitrospinota bacterium]